MTNFNLYFMFFLPPLILFIIYLVLSIKCKNKQLIDTVFKYIFAIMPIILFVICIVFLLIMKDNTTDYFALFVSLFIFLVFITSLVKRNINCEKIFKKMLVRFALYIFVQILLSFITVLLEKNLPVSDLVTNRCSIVFIISMLMYSSYQILLLSDERKIQMYRLAFEINFISYITIYILFYLVQDNNSSEISKIIVLCSLILVFFDKIDDFIEYFICD